MVYKVIWELICPREDDEEIELNETYVLSDSFAKVEKKILNEYLVEGIATHERADIKSIEVLSTGDLLI